MTLDSQCDKMRDMRIAVIIPVYNEAKHIQQALNPLQQWRSRGHEVIVVDGGSDDQTIECCTGLVDQCLVSEKGRARQMNTGARHTTADLLIFLHADTLIEPAADISLLKQLPSDRVWGRFDVRLSGRARVFRLIERLMNWRSCLTGISTGDQGIFVRHQAFVAVKGYADIPLMEDIDLSQKLKRLSHPVCLTEQVVTSSRRWEHQGILKTILTMWLIRISFFFGVSAQRLARWYGVKIT